MKTRLIIIWINRLEPREWKKTKIYCSLPFEQVFDQRKVVCSCGGTSGINEQYSRGPL